MNVAGEEEEGQTGIRSLLSESRSFDSAVAASLRISALGSDASQTPQLMNVAGARESGQTTTPATTTTSTTHVCALWYLSLAEVADGSRSTRTFRTQTKTEGRLDDGRLRKDCATDTT